MKELIAKHGEIIGKQMAETLKKLGYSAEFLPDAGAARARLLALIPEGAGVGFGGSMTVAALDIKGELAKKGCAIYDHQGVADPEEAAKIRQQELNSDVFLTSTNAVTKKGELYNVDGKGNRVAAMIFGPKEVILVAGVNKIVPDLEAAEERVCQIAAPINNMRLSTGNPCTVSGVCADCASARRICNAVVILRRCPPGTKFRILIVGEAMGF